MNPDSIKHGGPAFPCPMSEQTYSNQDCAPFQPGMTLRDHFAGLAMQALISSPFYRVQGGYKGWAEIASGGLAEEAYSMADEMIKARGQS